MQKIEENEQENIEVEETLDAEEQVLAGERGMSYTDDSGNKLYGFSHHDLSILNLLLKILIGILGAMLLAGLFVLYWLHSHDYLTRMLEAILGR